MRSAQVIIMVLVLFVLPAQVRAANPDFVTSIWEFPSRSANEITSWIWGETSPPTPPAKVLGVKDLTTAPIIEESVARPDLGAKMDSTGSSLEKLYLDYQLVLSETVLIGLNWDNLTVSDVTAAVDKQNSVLSDTGQVLDGLSRAWGWTPIDAIKTKINSVKTNLATVRSITSTSGMQTVAYDQLKSSVKEMEDLVVMVGDKVDAKTKNTLYGKYSEVRETAFLWDDLRVELDAMLTSSDYTSLGKLEARVLALNQIPHISTLLSNDPKNRILGLVAVVDTNKTLMAQDRGQTITSTWLEQTADSNISFKTLVINPSVLARQEITVKYYLPVEIQSKDVISHDSSLEIRFDEAKKQVFVQGNIVVAADDARVVNLETKDIWDFDQATLEAERVQATALVDSMAGSPGFVQAVVLKGKIDANIQKVQVLQTGVVTPEQKIKAYRQTVMLQAEIDTNLGEIQQLAKTDKSGPFQGFKSWKQIAMIVGGLVFVVMGFGMLANPGTRFGAMQKKKGKLEHIKIFTGSGIASSDL